MSKSWFGGLIRISDETLGVGLERGAHSKVLSIKPKLNALASKIARTKGKVKQANATAAKQAKQWAQAKLAPARASRASKAITAYSKNIVMRGDPDEILGLDCIVGDAASDLQAMDDEFNNLNNGYNNLLTQDATLQYQISSAQPVWTNYVNSQVAQNAFTQWWNMRNPPGVPQPGYDWTDPQQVIYAAQSDGDATSLSVAQKMLGLVNQDVYVQQQAQALSSRIDALSASLDNYTQNLQASQANQSQWQAQMQAAQAAAQGNAMPPPPTTPAYNPATAAMAPSYGGGYYAPSPDYGPDYGPDFGPDDGTYDEPDDGSFDDGSLDDSSL